MIFSVPLFIFCVYCRFLLFGYPEAYIKHLMGIKQSFFFILIGTFLFSYINIPSVYSFYIFDVTIF